MQLDTQSGVIHSPARRSDRPPTFMNRVQTGYLTDHSTTLTEAISDFQSDRRS